MIFTHFRDMKIKHKIMGIFIVIGTIPILLLGLFTFHQERNAVKEREEKTILSSLTQAGDQLDSQILIYNNLSDYIAFNQPISEVLGGGYDSVYEMYAQYTKSVDPVLSSLKYFNSNISQITVYIDKNIVKHDTTVDSVKDMKNQSWYKKSKVTPGQNIQWVVDGDESQAFSVRTMPLLAQDNKLGVVYLSVNYNNLFSVFSDINMDNSGIVVLDSDNNVIYNKSSFDSSKDKQRFKVSELLKMEKSKKNGKKIDALFVSYKMQENGWRVIEYKPEKLIEETTGSLLLLLVGILAICIVTAIVASWAFSHFVVRDIEKLRDNMQAVENGDRKLTVSSKSHDEVGGLIQGFGSMLEEINHLINEVYEGKLTLRKSEMTALQAQINPHFLYNSLSLINWKALEAGQKDISRITLALSSFYRTSLNRGKNVLTIEKEIENMRSYLEIQLCMHDNSFDTDIDIDENILQCTTLNLILQPLVENAIEHGIDCMEEGRGYIKIVGRTEDDFIYLTVEDNGPGMNQEELEAIWEYKAKGYGVKNVNERIKLYYGEQYGLTIESQKSNGTKCIIKLPANSEQEA